MLNTFSRRGGARRPHPFLAPRVAHFYLNLTDWRLFCLNETARQLVQEGIPINPADLAQQPLLHMNGEPVMESQLPILAAGRERACREATFLWPRPGGAAEVLSWSAAPLTDQQGTAVGVTATVVLGPHAPDWEELAGLSHDLRTPLQALRLLVPLALTQPGPETMADVLQRIRSASDRAMSIAQELLEWCKAPVQVALRAVRDWMPLEPLLTSLVLEHEMSARNKGIRLEMDLEAVRGQTILSNRVRLGRLIGNLLVNAIRYTSAGKVRLYTSWRTEPEPALVITVEDTGAGMTEEEQESIFEPFHRGQAGMADSDSGGSGIGLATVDRLVVELGLTLEISSAVGQGSRFDLIIPAELVRGEPC